MCKSGVLIERFRVSGVWWVAGPRLYAGGQQHCTVVRLSVTNFILYTKTVPTDI